AKLAEIDGAATRIVVCLGDVARAADVERILGQIDRELPPLRGVVHAAGVLADGGLLGQSWADFERVMAGKALGAVHLHRMTGERTLDFFVMFSSMTSLLGTPGQGNY